MSVEAEVSADGDGLLRSLDHLLRGGVTGVTVDGNSMVSYGRGEARWRKDLHTLHIFELVAYFSRAEGKYIIGPIGL